jgi:hypothetical protein
MTTNYKRYIPLIVGLPACLCVYVALVGRHYPVFTPLLEGEHPEAFDYSDTEACERGSELARAFLRRHLAMDGIELNEDGFMMLWSDFNCSHHFYTRADDYKRRKS